jgi:hypothetical protein
VKRWGTLVRLVLFLNHAEAVPVRVCEDDVVSPGRIPPVDPGGPEVEKALDLGWLVGGIEVEVMTLVGFGVGRDHRNGHLRACAVYGHEDGPKFRGFLAWAIVEGR